MANFKLPKNGPDISAFHLPLGRTMTLLQSGGDPSGNRLDVGLDRSLPSVDLAVLPDKMPAASTLFTLKGAVPNVDFSVSASLPGSSPAQRYSQDLAVKVCGAPKKHASYDVDLLSDLAITGDSRHVHFYTQAIKGPQNKDNILSQDTRSGHFNCGDVAAAYGPKLFAKDAYVTNGLLYIQPKAPAAGDELQMTDLRFDAARVKLSIDRVKAKVATGTPVRVWMIHHDGFQPQIRADWRSHYLTIIGYTGDRFLYIDPWPSGSKLDYDGGMYPSTRVAFLGELTWDSAHLELGIHSPAGKLGLHDYWVIGAP